MRKRMVATGSPVSKSDDSSSSESSRPDPDGESGTVESGTATKSIRVVRNRPVPRPVRLGSEIDSTTERTMTRSPTTRGRA